MMVLGLLIHILLRVGNTYMKQKAEFKGAIFFKENIIFWLISILCSVAMLIVAQESQTLVSKYSTGISLGIGYMNSSLFKYVAQFYRSFAKKKLNIDLPEEEASAEEQTGTGIEKEQ